MADDSSVDSENDELVDSDISSDDGIAEQPVARKRLKYAQIDGPSSARIAAMSNAEKDDYVKRAAIVLRFILSKSKDNELDMFDRAKARLSHSYSPFVNRNSYTWGPSTLFKSNSVRGNIPGKRFIILDKIRNNMLENRWIDVISLSREFLKFQYCVATYGCKVMSSGLIKPLAISYCAPMSSPDPEKLQQIFAHMSNLPRSSPRQMQLELANFLLFASDQKDYVLNALRQPLRSGPSFYRIKEPIDEAEVFARQSILADVDLAKNSLKLSRSDRAFASSNPEAVSSLAEGVLASSDHWVAASLAWSANLKENSRDLKTVLRCISSNEEHRQVLAPASCRLRYALSLADILMARLKPTTPEVEEGLCGRYDDIKAQYNELLWYSPSDELLYYYSETANLSEDELVALLFHMLDSPKLARRQKLWWRLRSVIVTSLHSSTLTVNEIKKHWAANRDSWWPRYVTELNLPKGSLKFARRAMSTLENL